MNGHRAACRPQRAESPKPCPATRTRCRPTGTGCRPMTRGSRGTKLPSRGRKFPCRGNFRPRHISGGAGDGIKEMLRKKFYVVRKKNHVVRKIFYVASISVGAAGRKNRPRWRKTSRRCVTFVHRRRIFSHGIHAFTQCPSSSIKMGAADGHFRCAHFHVQKGRP